MTNARKTPQPEWWSEAGGFFGPDYLEEYDFLTTERTKREIDFIINTICLGRTDLRFLDVPCGHGRHALELRRRQCSVVGYELNPFFLDLAKQAAWGEKFWHPDREHSGKLQFQKGDMRLLPFTNEFHVVLNLFTSLGYFGDDAEDEKFFTGAFKALLPGGIFVIDFVNQGWLMRNWNSNNWRRLIDDSHVVVERQFDYLEGYTNDWRTTIKPDGSRITKHFRHRVYAPHELIALAKRVGFEFKKAYGDFAGEPLTIDSKRMILVFGKSANYDLPRHAVI